MSEVVSKDPKDPKKPKNHNFVCKDGVITCTFSTFLEKDCEYMCSQDDHPGYHCDRECFRKHRHCLIEVYGHPCGLLFKHEHCDKCGQAIIDDYHETDCPC